MAFKPNIEKKELSLPTTPIVSLPPRQAGGQEMFPVTPSTSSGLEKNKESKPSISLPSAITKKMMPSPLTQSNDGSTMHNLQILGPSPNSSSHQQMTNSSGLQAITSEISVLSQNGKPIGPEHYRRLKQLLDNAFRDGADPREIKKLREMLEPLNPEKIPLLSSSQKEFRKNPEIPIPTELTQIPECGGQQMFTAPVDLKKLYSISPLGSIGPPGHTFPTEHMFLHITAGGVTNDTIPLYAPADVYITLIAFSRGLTNDPVDYTIYMALCRDVFIYYNHVKMLSPEFEAVVAKNECAFPGESKDTRCNIETVAYVKNATLIGRVGALQGNFDLGLFDLRKTNVFANPSKYGIRSLHIQCPLDYYEPSVKASLFSLVEEVNKNCGEIAQDITGTLQGNWFFEQARADSGSDWNKYLAFVHKNDDDSISIVSIGGVITEPKTIQFQAQTSGVINRRFRDVASDGNIYCYAALNNPGRVLIKMLSSITLQIEYQTQNCSESFVFQNPREYSR